MMKRLIIIALSIPLFFSVAAISAKDPAQGAWQSMRYFLRDSQENARGEHRLPPQSDLNILKLQRWTKSHEGYVAYQSRSGPIALFFLTKSNTKSFKLEELFKVYAVYSERATTLLPEVFREFPFHVGQITDESYARTYRQNFKKTMTSLLPDIDGSRKRLIPFDCDYLNQPTHALYFNLHATQAAFDLGLVVYQDEWLAKVQQFHTGNAHAESLEALRAHIQSWVNRN